MGGLEKRMGAAQHAPIVSMVNPVNDVNAVLSRAYQETGSPHGDTPHQQSQSGQ
jgi:hypothetical protein